MKGAEAPLEPCVRPLHAELVEAAIARGDRPPSQRAVRRQLATLVALLEELGAVRWRPDVPRMGTAGATMLGGFGFFLLMAAVERPGPEHLALLTEAGYLPAAGGWSSTATTCRCRSATTEHQRSVSSPRVSLLRPRRVP